MFNIFCMFTYIHFSKKSTFRMFYYIMISSNCMYKYLNDNLIASIY